MIIKMKFKENYVTVVPFFLEVSVIGQPDTNIREICIPCGVSLKAWIRNVADKNES